MSESWPPAWPRVLDAEFGAPVPGEYRAAPEDFVVEECLDFTPEGQGEHLWLWVEKRDLSTLEVARRLARACEVTQRDIGYAGMKDRVAVTRQWLSVHLPGREAPADLAERLADTPLVLLEQQRHPRKLKRGVHRANRFTLRLSGAVVDDPRLEARWRRLIDAGVPNYFGPQRFGPAGRNLSKARAILAKGWRKRDDREGMLLSTARSYLFNQLLARRIAAGDWATPVDGELLVLDGSASQFASARVDAELLERAARLDVHPSGALWGTGDAATSAAALAHEQAVIAAEPALAEGLVRAGVRMARRPLRVRLGEPSLERHAGALTLRFALPRGAFATAALRELIEHPSL
ncbi:tRNA pseudouridine(13) synthase TruD [Halomonas sp. 1513]|nr:tRNA pseudouridine(13) synthase TruD [Halomonas sp. 1513]APX92403.1 tRNA pseudouridine(13) synthase TruD [Halomonas sp. 1513]